MKILMINSVCGIRSTGRICTDLAERFAAEGHEVRIAYGRMGDVPDKCLPYAHQIGGSLSVRLHGLKTRLLDRHGFGSKAATRAFLKWAEDYRPDLLWLQNLHGYYINVEMLFDWIKKHPEMQVKWTLHDCWAFTGHCSHFSYVGCEKWKTQCASCPQKAQYPASCLDNSQNNFQRKMAAFTGVQNMTLITPSQWLADLTKQSFLGCYPVEVQYNTINRDIFKPTPGNFREQYGLQQQIIILGVASYWNDRKGLQDFESLRTMLDSRYAIVLVGLSERQIAALPEGMLGIRHTNSPQELAEIYTAADVFVNPTMEDTMPMVNLEALACGTPVVTFRTGGCPEAVNADTGTVVEQADVDGLREAIRRITPKTDDCKEACLQRAQFFSANRRERSAHE